MDHAHRPLRAAATLATAGALALTPIAVAPHDVHAPNISPAHLSTQAVQLDDAWSDLLAATAANVNVIAKLFVGAESGAPLPNPTIFLAPIATQLVLNQLIYAGQLFRGQGGQIPGEISTHLTNVAKVFGEVLPALPQLIPLWVETPFAGIEKALASISTATNPLIGLLEAPAVFLNVALNSTTGLLGGEGPIAFPIIIRNVLATSIDPPLPGWLSHILQPAKAASAAALTPKSTVSLKVATAPHTASSAKPRSTSAKAGNAGVGHGKRN